MTVCVAGMGGGTVIGASDRMITSGDVEFEPEQSKISSISNSIAVMIAGDIALQVELIAAVRDVVERRINASPEDWWTVREAANRYFATYEEARALRAARAVLHPLGMTLESFRHAQTTLSQELVMRISMDIVNFAMPSVEAIFLGIDTQGPQIYRVDNDGVTCQNGVGFAAIGIGAQHALSQLMFSAHHKFKSMPEALLAVYSAKRRAEIAPGVGSATDMCFAGPGKGQLISIGDHVLRELHRCYSSVQENTKAALHTSNERIARYVESLYDTEEQREQSAGEQSHGDAQAADGGPETLQG